MARERRRLGGVDTNGESGVAAARREGRQADADEGVERRAGPVGLADTFLKGCLPRETGSASR